MLQKLEYIGINPNGVDIVLYKSYKTVTLTPERNVYALTEKDNKTQEAINYYRLYFSNLVECIIEGSTAEEEIEEVDDTIEVEEPSNTEADDRESEEELETEVDTSPEEISLEDKLEDVDAGVIKEKLLEVNPELKFGRKRKNTIIDEYKDEYKEVFEELVR